MVLEGLLSTAVMPKTVRLTTLIKNGLSAAESKDKPRAHESYRKAKQIYGSLSFDSKHKYYNELMELYKRLDSLSKAEEVSLLAEKYSKGELTEGERRRLTELLSEY